MTSKKNVIFFHPDLGIGGAERLVIDAAVGLQSLGHKVTIFTSHCDPSHCFDEAKDDTLDVRVRGNSIFPATLLGRFKILFTILRHVHLLITITITGELRRLQPTAFFIDQISAGIPLLRHLWPDIHLLFYCHFPDLLLVQQKGKWWRRIWRIGFDWLEGWGMRGADRVVVNSEFTKSVVEEIWRGLGGSNGIGIVYPCVDTTGKGKFENEERPEKPLWDGKKIVLSINRFEKKKNVGLAIRSFAGIRKGRDGARLVVAGGYDNREQENVSYHAELVSLADDLGLSNATAKNIVSALSIPDDIDVLFLLSVPNQLKQMLLNVAKLLVYTPSNEHFGIVPLEAMLAGVPVLAADSGGPLETVVEGETGWLRPVEEIELWTEVMQKVLLGMSSDQLKKMGQAGKDRVRAEFSEAKLAMRLDDELEITVNRPRAHVMELQDFLLGLGVAGMLAVAVAAISRPLL